MKKLGKIGVIFCLVYFGVVTGVILQPAAIKPYMFTTQITGNLSILKPTALGNSSLWPLPLEVYEIAAMRSNEQLLPSNFPTTPLFVYAGKVNGVYKPQYPGPGIIGLKNQPAYVRWLNSINGTHILPVDLSHPFNMISQYMNEVPTVPHAHGLETQTGTDGQPMGFWTSSGRMGPDYFSLNSNTKLPNQAIFRYHNTKEGLNWYHDHAMGITRLSVYAGLVGYYEIIDPSLSIEQRNILWLHGDYERKYLVITDKTFNTDGSLYYPSTSFASEFTSWVPEFFGNTMLVNGKVWPKITLKPKKYRIVLLNGCQSRYLNIYFQNIRKKLEFKIFRRDSDYLRNPVAVKEHLLMTGSRIEIFLDLTGVNGIVLLKNNAPTPYPMGDIPDGYTSHIMKIVMHAPNAPYTPGPTFTQQIRDRLIFYNSTPFENLDFFDQPQAIIPNGLASPPVGNLSERVITSQKFVGSTNPDNKLSLDLLKGQINGCKATPDLLLNQINSLSDAYISKNLTTINKLLTKPPQNTTQNTTQPPQQIPLPVPILTATSPTTITDVPYPRFPAGTPVYPILIQTQNSDGEVTGAMIDGVGVAVGCAGSTYRFGQVYDFFIINLTMDDHPIHIHLVNFQVIGRFAFNAEEYKAEYQQINGPVVTGGYARAPTQVPISYPTNPADIEPPSPQQQQFLDIIQVPTGKVTVARVKFSNHYGESFPFDIAGAKYVWHCHILEHEDNEMMRYFCTTRPYTL